MSNAKYISGIRDTTPFYLINLITGTRLSLDITPDEITDSVGAEFEEQPIRGRSSPLKGYSSSGPRQVSFTITTADDYCKDGLVPTVNMLKAMVYPVYSGIVVSPEIYLRIGYLIAMKAVLNSVDVTWKKPIRNGFYTVADISFDFSEVVDIPRSAEEIEQGGDFNG